MSKVKVKKIKMSVGSGDEDIADMFNQMLGAGGAINAGIAYPRYLRIRGLCEKLIQVFELLASSPFMRAHAEFASQKAEIEKFCADSRASITELFGVVIENPAADIDDILKTQFTESYEQVKKSELVNTFIVMCDHLVNYRKNFNDLDKLSHKFIYSMSGTEWSPFPFTTLNLKYIFSLTSLGASSATFFLTILYKAYEQSYKLYEETQSPDIDVDQFVDVIMNNIDEIQKRPELSRCRKAFQKIKESVSLLKDRFNGYYRDFIATKDSTIMMQHFVLDVSKETNADPEVTRQFRAIIAYYRKIAPEQIKNPKVKMLFDRVNESFKELERGTTNLVNIREEEDDDDYISENEETNFVSKSADDLAREAAAMKSVDDLAREIERTTTKSVRGNKK